MNTKPFNAVSLTAYLGSLADVETALSIVLLVTAIILNSYKIIEWLINKLKKNKDDRDT